MSHAMTPSHSAVRDQTDAWLLDEEAWDPPCRLTRAELFAHAGAGRRRSALFDDPEDN